MRGNYEENTRECSENARKLRGKSEEMRGKYEGIQGNARKGSRKKAFSQGTCSKKRGPKCELAKINHDKTAGKRPNRRNLWVGARRPWGVEKRTLAGDLLQNTRSEEGILKIEGPECTRDPPVFVVFMHKNHTPPRVGGGGGRR